MKGLSRVRESLSFVRRSLCLVFISLFVLAQGVPASAVRLSDAEVSGPIGPEGPSPEETVPEETEEQAPPPSRAPVTREKDASQEVKTRPRKVPAAPASKKEGQEEDSRFVTIDFDNVDLVLFVKFISEVTGKNFVIDEKARGKVTIVSPTKISVDEAYRVFESVLEVQGFTTVPSGNIIKIVSAVEARGKNIETRIKEEAPSEEDKVVTQVLRLNYANPDELKRLFAPLISKNSVIVAYPPTGMLIITDVLSNIKRLLRIISAIDVAGIGAEISVVPLEHADSDAMVKTLTSIFQASRTQARGKQAPAVEEPTIQIVADARTNSVILSASEQDTVRIKKLISILDQETPRGAGDIRVYYLQYADAEELAKVLTALPTKETKQQAGKPTAPVISKEVQIVADKATNSLVITASKQDYMTLMDVIKQLDISRPMVYLEALIMEVKADKNFRIGVEWRVGDDIGTWENRKIGAFGGSIPGDTSAIATAISSGSLPSGLSFGVLGEGITLDVAGTEVTFPSIAAMAQAMQNDSDVHILQTPQVLTTDNEEAQIVVADNVPYLTKEATGEQQYQTYEYKDVGVTLKITPQINQERFVRLKTFLEYITLKPEQGAEFRPTTLKRSADTTLVVQDSHTVVIGGLVGDQISRGTSSVPCLGSIPVLGWLFKGYSKTETKTNLFVFVTPHIIENPSEAKELFEEKKMDFQKMEEGVIKMYGMPMPDDAETDTPDNTETDTDEVLD